MVGPWDLVMEGMCLQVIFMTIIPTKRDFVRYDNVRNSTTATDDDDGDEVQHVPVWLVIRIIIASIAIKCQMDWKSMHRIANALQDSQPEYLHYHHHHRCCPHRYHDYHDSSPLSSSLPSLTR